MALPGLAAIVRFLLKPPVLALAVSAWVLGNRRRRRRLFIGVGATLTLCVVLGELLLDHRHLPWRPLDVDARAGLATGLKLRAIELGPDRWCRAHLQASAHLAVRPLEAHDDDGACGWSQAVHIQSSGGRTLVGRGTYPMQCALGLGAHIWISSADHHARTILGSGLVRVHHAGTYSCRRMYNRRGGRMSQHAYANAWDVTGFELADGRVISVLKHWPAGGKPGRFLRAVHRDACRIFNITLGPDYNAAHADHFHVDMSHRVSCR